LAPVKQHRPWYRDPSGLALGVSGIALVAVGGGLLGVAMSERNQALGATTVADFNTHHSSDLKFEAAGWSIMGIGIDSAVTGAVVLTVKGLRR
jgi:hypothetical protein